MLVNYILVESGIPVTENDQTFAEKPKSRWLHILPANHEWPTDVGTQSWSRRALQGHRQADSG